MCLSCHSPLAANQACSRCLDNWLCHFETCHQPVRFFCLCSDPPRMSCEEHLSDHRKTVNPDCLLYTVNAMPVLGQLGPQEFRRDRQIASFMSECITRELGRLDSHQISYDEALSELKSRVADLELHGQELARRRAALREAHLQMSPEHYSRPASETLRQLGATDSHLPELPLLSFDKETALQALLLQPAEVNWALAKLTWAAAELQTPNFHEASLCWIDDKALVTGGAGSRAAWMLTRRAKEQLQDMREERMSHGVVRYQDWVYVFGGRIGTSSAVKSWERYSLIPRTWDRHGSMKEERRFFSPGVHQGKIYLAGGLCESIEVFDPVSERFTWVAKGLPSRLGGLVLSLSDQLLVLFDKGIYCLGAQPAFVAKEHGVSVQMHSLTTALYTDAAAYLLVPLNSQSRQLQLVKLRIALEDNTVTVTECT